jgi:hypothetical protein
VRWTTACILSLPLLSGCSSIIASSGLDASNFENQQQVARWLGKPVEIAATDAGSKHVYHTRWKFADRIKAGMYGNSCGMTFGLTEPSAIATELIELNEMLIKGRDIQFEFDEQGEVIKHHIPGRFP